MITGFLQTANRRQRMRMMKDQVQKKFVTKVLSKNKTKDKTKTTSKRMMGKALAKKTKKSKGTVKVKIKAVDKIKAATTPINNGAIIADYGRRMYWHRRKPTS